MLLAIMTFGMSLIGTFLVRSGVLTSVHSFAVDPTRGVFILLLIGIVIGGGLILYARRVPDLSSGNPFAPVSREAALVINNLLLAAGMATVFLGTLLSALCRGMAYDAFNHTMALAPANIALHAELGEALVLEAQSTVTPAAEDEFAKAPDDPRSRYYATEAALQHDDPAAAKKKLDALLANAPSDAPWRQTVADRLAELSQNVGAAPSARASGPTLRDIAPAQSMNLK